MKEYFMLSKDQLQELLGWMFQEGWWVRQNQRDYPHNNDTYGTMARDKAVFNKLRELSGEDAAA